MVGFVHLSNSDFSDPKPGEYVFFIHADIHLLQEFCFTKHKGFTLIWDSDLEE